MSNQIPHGPDRPMALDTLAAGVASLLGQWETSDALYGEGAKAIIHWVLTHELIGEALGEVREITPQGDARAPDLHDLMYRVLGLPLY